ncbi:hypothetical protein JTE90_006435 [Oedothorax gibbosus]|uniref:Uncharacterized protein n=1 Tax=Oedothorax gibbosus TaxID=931172 RepID=A0AAV6TJE7_9ARAC|nr:hypothetical protein JTE90_006435 [Oedothorax gibbosus]
MKRFPNTYFRLNDPKNNCARFIGCTTNPSMDVFGGWAGTKSHPRGPSDNPKTWGVLVILLVMASGGKIPQNRHPRNTNPFQGNPESGILKKGKFPFPPRFKPIYVSTLFARFSKT